MKLTIETPTLEQNHLLDVMLNPAILPPERAAAGRELAELGDPRRGVGVNDNGIPDIEWVDIPDEGEFLYQDKQKLRLPSFAISRYLITYKQFQAFVEANDGYDDDQWWQGLEKAELKAQRFEVWNHPRDWVKWYQAVAFCRWLSARLGYDVRLPTEQQWEKAARGRDGRIFPWGGETYISGYANINETEQKEGPHYLHQTTAVGLYPQGASPYGVEDMAGNVWEWCLNAYSRNAKDEDISSGAARVLRGGSYVVGSDFARATFRSEAKPGSKGHRSRYFGFRVVAKEQI